MPIVGLAAGGADMHQETLQVIVVNDTGLVTDFTYSASDSEFKTGVLNQ